MAQLKNGANGGFSGKVGSVVGYHLRGKHIIRGLPKPITKKPSEKQLAARAKFARLQQWRSPLTDFFAVTFKNHTRERSAQNAAHHFNAGIVIGEYPNYSLDYSAVVISQGHLPFVNALTMTIGDDQSIQLSWEPNMVNEAAANDLVATLICDDQGNCIDANLNAATRAAGQYLFKLAPVKDCNAVHIYFTVISNDRESAANSQYLGKIDLDNQSL